MDQLKIYVPFIEVEIHAIKNKCRQNLDKLHRQNSLVINSSKKRVNRNRSIFVFTYTETNTRPHPCPKMATVLEISISARTYLRGCKYATRLLFFSKVIYD